MNHQDTKAQRKPNNGDMSSAEQVIWMKYCFWLINLGVLVSLWLVKKRTTKSQRHKENQEWSEEGRQTTAVRLSCGSGFLAAIKTESTIYPPYDMIKLLPILYDRGFNVLSQCFRIYFLKPDTRHLKPTSKTVGAAFPALSLSKGSRDLIRNGI